MILSIKKFLKASLYSSPEDIERTPHKVVNLVLKIISIVLFVIGILAIREATLKYFIEFKSMYPPASDQKTAIIIDRGGLSSASGDIVASESLSKEEKALYALYDIFFLIAFGAGAILAGMGIGQALILRYIAFVLPDRIYQRSFASPDEKEKKKRF